jgi:hypothetical protein
VRPPWSWNMTLIVSTFPSVSYLHDRKQKTRLTPAKRPNKKQRLTPRSGP